MKDFPVNRPVSPVIDAVDQIIDRIENAKMRSVELDRELARINAAKNALREEAKVLREDIHREASKASAISDLSDRRSVIRFLYNSRRLIRARTLIAAMFGVSEINADRPEWRKRFLDEIGPIGWGPCSSEGCGSLVPIVSSRAGNNRKTCDGCVDARREINAQERLKDEARRKADDLRFQKEQDNLDAAIDLLGLSDKEFREMINAGFYRLHPGPGGGVP